MVLERVDSLALRRFIDRFNDSYKEKLLSEQKDLIGKFISYPSDSLELKIYLNEELHRLKDKLKTLESSEDAKTNDTYRQNVLLVKEHVDSMTIDKVDEVLIEKIMFVQEFTKEVVD